MIPPTLTDIQSAQKRIHGAAIRTPLIRLHVEDAPAEIYLKLENLQPIGSFKIRGASNAMALASPSDLAKGVYTASAGNMAQGVAWNAQRLGVPCHVVVPDHAPETKLAAITRMGASYIKVPWAEWWEIIVTHQYDPLAELAFVHPVSDPAVIAGNGTIGLEILEDLPDVNTVLVPYGGGGLSCGIATAIKALRPQTRVLAAEPETAPAVQAAFAAGEPTTVEYQPSFVDGSGGQRVLDDMWGLTSQLLDGSCVVSLAETATAIRLMVERARIVAEGAGALATAAALSGQAGAGKIVCVVSGGNIDNAKLSKILQGQVP
jgi:threonine dehydratase